MRDLHRERLIEHLERVHRFDDAFALDRKADHFLDRLHDTEHGHGHLARLHVHL